MYVYRNGSEERRQRQLHYSSCCELLGVRRNTLPSRDCGESVRDGEQRLSIHSYCGGKSLCYAVLPRVFDMLRGNDTPQSLVILISPALMKDQLRIV